MPSHSHLKKLKGVFYSLGGQYQDFQSIKIDIKNSYYPSQSETKDLTPRYGVQSEKGERRWGTCETKGLVQTTKALLILIF